ncbi:uncharacterized protein LOC117579830 [Drosophila guanche]|uniref:Uncharacterized protein n=1 Tax=Drosophila guanche TaxID=7266 RepID=A0A3B0JS39_DROGU|nr:uncharacterized protein LOC117579830 [Drosophila guanche]SPP76176.1 Hypothetical predicted protein [Drosophila guanche]
MLRHYPTATPVHFRIQLLSDKKVVMVEAAGYETEIFLPQLLDGRINLKNIIRSRQPRQHQHQHQHQLQNFDSFADSRSIQSKVRQRSGQSKLTTATAGLAPPTFNGDVFAAGGSNVGNGPQFALKLISNGSVVLVESNGYESEIFLPHMSCAYVSMKRVTASQLVQCSCLTSKQATRPEKINPNPTAVMGQPKSNRVNLPNATRRCGIGESKKESSVTFTAKDGVEAFVSRRGKRRKTHHQDMAKAKAKQSEAGDQQVKVKACEQLPLQEYSPRHMT